MVGEVVLLIFVSGDYDIDICEHIVRYLLLKNGLRESSKGGASVYEAFGHAHEAVHAKGFNKASLVFVFFHVNLVITQEAIKEQHDFAHYRRVDNLVYSWQGEIILSAFLIKASEVHAHPPLAIFLFTMTTLASHVG
jgi:hypothetical protein